MVARTGNAGAANGRVISFSELFFDSLCCFLMMVFSSHPKRRGIFLPNGKEASSIEKLAAMCSASLFLCRIDSVTAHKI